MSTKLLQGLALIFFLSSGLVLSSNAATTMSLRYVLEHTLIQNPQVLKSIALAAGAQANVKTAFGSFLPRVDVRFATGKEETDNTSTNGNNVILQRTEAGLVITQPIFSGFSSYNLVKQRHAELKSAKFSQIYTKNEVMLLAIHAYLNILRLQQLKNLTNSNIIAHQKILAKVRRKFSAGAGRRTEVDLAAARLANRRAAMSAIIGAQRNAATNFTKITGLTPKNLTYPAPPEITTNVQQLVNTALIKNPTLLAANANLMANNASVAVTKSKLLPQLDIEISANRNSNIGGIRGKDRDVRGMLVANYNIFNGAADHSAIDRAKQIRMAALYARNDTRRSVIAAVNQSWDTMHADRNQLIMLQQHAKAAQNVLTGYRKQFLIGRRSLLNVLDMENELFNAQVSVINSRFAVRNDIFNLLANVGVLVNYFV